MEETVITEKQLNELYETLKMNSELVGEWNNRLMASCEDANWSDVVYERAKILREVYQENEKLFNEFFSSLPMRMSWQEWDLLFELLWNLHENSLYVVSFGLRLARYLLPHYEDMRDFAKIVFLNYAMGCAHYLLFDQTLNADGPSEWLQYFERITTYEDHYAEIPREAYRGLFFTAYLNLIQYSAEYPSLSGRASEFRDRCMALWNREEVQKLDGNAPYVKAIVRNVEEQYLNILSMNPSCITNAEEYCVLAEQALNKMGRINLKSDPLGYYKIMENSYKRIQKQTSEEASVVSMSDYILKALPAINFEKSDSKRTWQLLRNEHSCFAYAAKALKKLPAEKGNLLQGALNRLIKDSVHTPHTFYPEDFNWTFYEFYGLAAPLLDNAEDKLSLLLNLILRRQPTTYVHSMMVSKIARMIGESVLEHNPSLFIGLLGYATEKEILENREKILSYVERSGLLHDVGKCRVAIIINTQDRKLSEDEYGILKYHPSLGAKLLEDDPDFTPYVDVIRGHHKTYDGKGYPKDFDNVNSPVRVLIDLIRLADSADAGTDVLGRYYTHGKTFQMILDEFKADAGTIYNPDLVALIENDKELCEKISHQTSDGRMELYQKICIEVMNMHKNA